MGGSDIVMEMFESGELAKLLGVEQPELGDEPRRSRSSPSSSARSGSRTG